MYNLNLKKGFLRLIISLSLLLVIIGIILVVLKYENIGVGLVIASLLVWAFYGLGLLFSKGFKKK
jgi:drug/metabolite transporter (DMT)-like permease